MPLEGAFEAEDGEIVVPFDMATMKASPKASDNHVLSGHEVEMYRAALRRQPWVLQLVIAASLSKS